uniref:Uncharacterized protein n=1 Tax=Triticum urartu TaxID=4572 RepID=A0A8R7R7Z8_TRIUA
MYSGGADELIFLFVLLHCISEFGQEWTPMLLLPQRHGDLLCLPLISIFHSFMPFYFLI